MDIMRLAKNPRPSGVKKLKGPYKGLGRIRSGMYRVIYRIYDDVVEVWIVRVAKREKAYDDLDSL